MAKQSKKSKQPKKVEAAETNDQGTSAGPPRKMKRAEYETEMAILRGELVTKQEWVKATRGEDLHRVRGPRFSGQGGTIRRITERTSPRVFKHVALPAPTEREKSQMYVQRYMAHFPAAGEVVIFDRSWYNRAGVEPVLGFCTPEDTARFLAMVPAVERAMVDSGIILVNYWLSVSVEEQARRLQNRTEDRRKIWKLTPTDLKSYSLRHDYCRARDTLFAAIDTPWAPWFVARNDDKKLGRLNIISHLLDQIPYETVSRADFRLPKPPNADGYVEPDLPLHRVPEKF